MDADTNELVDGARIVTFEEWLREFAKDPRIKLLWLDIKVEEPASIPIFIRRMSTLLNKYHVSHKVLYNVYDETTLDLFQKAMEPEGLDSRRVVVDNAIASYFLGPDVRKYSSVSLSIAKGTCCATQSRPSNSYYFSDEAFRKMVAYDMALREAYMNFTGVRIKIMSWTINDERTMSYLIDIGVDGVITNRPGLLSKAYMESRRSNRALNGNATLYKEYIMRCNKDWLNC